MGVKLNWRSFVFWFIILGFVMSPMSLSARMGIKGLWSKARRKFGWPNKKNLHLSAAQAAAAASPSIGA